MTNSYDDDVIEVFLNNQLQLFPENVAELPEEAEYFLEDCLAVVCDDRDEALEYMRESVDVDDMSDEEILASSEIFPIPDGRFLIVEG
ncbi:MAG: glyoxalase [Lachnospiraceae bacterium]|jgi:hypothetical protein|nr:glyoxalase [Lachnospiraceae bacterium]